MNTHKETAQKWFNEPVWPGLAAFAIGSLLGFVIGHPPVIPHSCPAPAPLSAHFLERRISFDLAYAPEVSSSSSSIETLRAAASEEASSASSFPSQIDIPVVVTTSASVSFGSSSVSSTESASSSASSEESASASSSAASSASASSTESTDASFPAFEHAVFPVVRAPRWGAMKTPKEWDRDYNDMERSDFQRVPAYDLRILTTPMDTLLATRDEPSTIDAITTKLFYSTRYFGSYDLDAGEFTGDHAGIDLKVPIGTPVLSIAGGRVSSVIRSSSGLGYHIIVEHRIGHDTYYAIYGHLSSIGVKEGQDVAPGDMIGRSGSTGRSTSGHLHLQIDRGTPEESPHVVYESTGIPSRSEASRYTTHPIQFIAEHAQ